jgi:hypothetical protein
MCILTMTETPEKVVRKYVESLTGRCVPSAWLALNSLVVELESEQPDDMYLWVEPTWHIRNDSGVILGSRQAQVEDKEAHAELNQVAAELDGRTIEHAAVDGLSHDLELHFSGGYALRTFVSDPADEEIWYIRDKSEKLAIGATPMKYFVTPVERFIPPNKK